MYVKLSNSDREYFLPFFDVFGHKPWLDSLLRQALFNSCHHKHPEGKKRCFWLADRNEPMQFSYSASISASRVSPPLAWIFGFFLFFFDTWCLSTNGRIGFKRFLMDQSRKGCYALFLEKHAMYNCCFILMHCHCQIMYVHVALRKSIHFREIFDWAFTDISEWLTCETAFCKKRSKFCIVRIIWYWSNFVSLW